MNSVAYFFLLDQIMGAASFVLFVSFVVIKEYGSNYGQEDRIQAIIGDLSLIHI
mgnify:CR=1 FL=1